MEDLQEQGKNQGDYDKVKMGGGASNFRPWLFNKSFLDNQWKEGQSGNPGGRPKGSKSLKTFAREFLESLPDEEKLEFMDGLPKDIVWRMAEGQPHQTNETDIKGTIKVDFAPEFNKDETDPAQKAE